MPLGIIFYSILNVTETMLECGIVMDAEEDSYAVGITVFGSSKVLCSLTSFALRRVTEHFSGAPAPRISISHSTSSVSE